MSVLYSSELTEKLNKYVEEKVDRRLFLICNYNPESLKVYGNDAKFMLGVMNLYKLFIDASICNKLGFLKKKYSLLFDYKRFEDIVSTVNSFRTYMGHNEDYRNGNEDDKRYVEQWFSRVIGKNYPETAEQYNKAVDELSKYGTESIAILEGFVEEVSNHIRKQEIVEDWEELIFDFYKRPNSKNIIKGHLRMSYQARQGSTNSYREVDMALWTESMLFYSEQSKIDTLKSLTKGRSLPASVLKDISEKIEENEKEIENKRRNVSAFLKKSEGELKPFDYLDYYASTFPQKIIDEYKSGSIRSLLPQDAVQQIIEDDFTDVPVR